MKDCIDTKAIREYADRLRKASKYFDFLENTAKDIGETILALVKPNTPVDTGRLRDSWYFKVEKTSKGYEVTVASDEEYASYVEFGHRTKNHKGWVDGFLMLTQAELEVYENMPEYLESKLIEEFKRWGL